MGKLIIAFLLFSPLLVGNPSLAADPAGRVLTTVELEGIYRQIVLAQTTLPQNQLRITGFSARPEAVRLPPEATGPLQYRVINPAPADRAGRKMVQVALLSGDQEIQTVRMTAELRLFALVVCVTRELPRHALLTEADLKVVEQDVTMLGSGLLSGPAFAVGKRLTTAVRPGTILFSRHLEAPPLVNRGDLVTIVVRSGPLEVRAPGEARSTGAQGELVRVKNLMSRRIVHALVQEPGLVTVEL